MINAVWAERYSREADTQHQRHKRCKNILVNVELYTSWDTALLKQHDPAFNTGHPCILALKAMCVCTP